MSDQTQTKKVFTFICERAQDMDSLLNGDEFKDVPGLHAIKFPCSGMIQPLMIEAAMKAGAEGVIVCGCQIGDCYYREGNKMIRERLLGERTPTLKRATDRRRILALWLSRLQADRFLSDAKEFMSYVKNLPAQEAAKPAAAAPAAAPKADAPKADAPKSDAKKEDAPKADAAKPDAKKEEKKETSAKADKSGDGKADEDEGASGKPNGGDKEEK